MSDMPDLDPGRIKRNWRITSIASSLTTSRPCRRLTRMEATGCGSCAWPGSIASMGILAVPMNDPMCVPSCKIFLCLNEAMKWGYRATLPGTGLMEWRLMGHAVVRLNQCYGGGLRTGATVPLGISCVKKMTPKCRVRRMPGMVPAAARLPDPLASTATSIVQVTNARKPGADFS